jgi:hypothetical protein
LNHPEDEKFNSYAIADPTAGTLEKWGLSNIVSTFSGYSSLKIKNKEADHILEEIASNILSGNKFS